MSKLFYRDIGRIDFTAALLLQEELVRLKQEENAADVLLLVEHPHVYTIGRGGKEANVLAPGDVPVIRTSRGGDVTYHGPGQIVVYPLIDLRSKLRKDVHRYLRNLETAAIRTLQGFNIEAGRKPPWTGIWIENRKVAAIGVGVRRGITYHGLALNVNTDLSYFQRIIPCGLAWAEVTSIQKEVGREVSLEQVKDNFLRQFVEKFDYTELKELCLEDIRIGSKSNLQAVPTISA